MTHRLVGTINGQSTGSSGRVTMMIVTMMMTRMTHRLVGTIDGESTGSGGRGPTPTATASRPWR